MSKRDQAVEMLESLRDEMGVSDSSMIEHVIYYYLSADDAVEVLEDIARENDIPLHTLHDSYEEEEY